MSHFFLFKTSDNNYLVIIFLQYYKSIFHWGTLCLLLAATWFIVHTIIIIKRLVHVHQPVGCVNLLGYGSGHIIQAGWVCIPSTMPTTTPSRQTQVFIDSGGSTFTLVICNKRYDITKMNKNSYFVSNGLKRKPNP